MQVSRQEQSAHDSAPSLFSILVHDESYCYPNSLCEILLLLVCHHKVCSINRDGLEPRKRIKKPFVLILNKGEFVYESILHCANGAKLQAATLSGIGAVKDTKVGVVAEIQVAPLSGKIERKLDPETGLNLIYTGD